VKVKTNRIKVNLQKSGVSDIGAKHMGPGTPRKRRNRVTKRNTAFSNLDVCRCRQTGRHLKISHSRAISCVKDHAGTPVPEETYTVEMDELYTLIEELKTGSTSSPL
jgi:hypothetical protein